MPALNAIMASMNPGSRFRRADQRFDPRTLDPRLPQWMQGNVGGQAKDFAGMAPQPMRPMLGGLSGAVNQALRQQAPALKVGPQPALAPPTSPATPPPQQATAQPMQTFATQPTVVPPGQQPTPPQPWAQGGMGGFRAGPGARETAQPYQCGGAQPAQSLSGALQAQPWDDQLPGGFMKPVKRSGKRGPGAGAPPAWSGRFVR